MPVPPHHHQEDDGSTQFTSHFTGHLPISRLELGKKSSFYPHQKVKNAILVTLLAGKSFAFVTNNGPVPVSFSRKNTKQEARHTGNKKIIVMPYRCLVAAVQFSCQASGSGECYTATADSSCSGRAAIAQLPPDDGYRMGLRIRRRRCNYE